MSKTVVKTEDRPAVQCHGFEQRERLALCVVRILKALGPKTQIGDLLYASKTHCSTRPVLVTYCDETKHSSQLVFVCLLAFNASYI